jgi:hypothetical protein
MRIPRAWTDADGGRAQTVEPEHVFTVDAMRTLGALVASLGQRCSPGRLDAASRLERATDAPGGGTK